MRLKQCHVINVNVDTEPFIIRTLLITMYLQIKWMAPLQFNYIDVSITKF